LPDTLSIENSERLRYRLLTSKDAEILFDLDQDPEVMRYISNSKATPMAKIRSTFLPRLASYTDYQKGWGMWGVFSLSGEAFLGWILVRPMHFFSAAPQFDDIELGWRFQRKFWGRGFASEAAKHIMYALYHQTGIQTYSAIAVKENKASIAIMEKLGMQYVSSGLHQDPLGDMRVDTYSITLTQ